MQSLIPEQNRSGQERSTLFLMLILGVAFVFMWESAHREPQAPQKQEVIDQPVKKDEDAAVKNEPQLNPDKSAVQVKKTEVSPAFVSLGSLEPGSPYRVLATFTNQGAAIARLELNSKKYRDVQESSGYLGQIVADIEESDRTAAQNGGGVIVQVVGDGTPAKTFGLQAGDRIFELTRIAKQGGVKQGDETTAVKNFASFRNVLLKTKPNEQVELTFDRKGQKISQIIILGHYPMDIIRPESIARNYDDYKKMGGLRGIVFNGNADFQKSDQLSFLTSFQSVDDNKLDLPKILNANNSALRGIISRDNTLDIELPNVSLRKECWEILSQTENEVVFRRTIPEYKLEMRKTYTLVKVENPNSKAGLASGYELSLKVEVHNLDTAEHKVAYTLDGPTGLPLEGAWYSIKTGPGWSGYGLRDIVVRFQGNKPQTIDNSTISSDKVDKTWIDDPLEYIGVDSKYFQCTLKPNKPSDEKDAWHVRSFPMRVGEKNSDWYCLTDVSFRLLSREKTLKPDTSLSHTYSVFVGPKDTRLLAHYNLGETISYGWFWFVAQPLLGILHFFNSFGLNYAAAIILLTVCVRLLMFPISIKQAKGAIKMQQIQPELQALAEKYKDDMQARSKAQSELFKKHNYHPASGCLPVFIQIPIFVGLYKALSIDAGLYGTPMISPAIRWCSDLSAPDALFDWSSFWTSTGWTSFNTGQGMFSLGPYFNLLPMLTIVLFLVQQQIMMPPPTDEQSRMQRKMMQYMMIFMGLMFFKIPSGLCIYFIASTLWGLAERRFIPKVEPVKVSESAYDVVPERVKQGKRKEQETKAAPKQEGFFRKMTREILERAADDNKFAASKKDKKDKDKKKKKR